MGVFLGDERNRDLIGDREAVTFERDDFSRMIGEDAQILESKINQNLRADAAFMLQLTLPGDVPVKLATRMIQNMR